MVIQNHLKTSVVKSFPAELVGESQKDLLVTPDPPASSFFGFFSKIFSTLSNSRNNHSKREIYLNGNTFPKIRMSNAVSNTKYSIISFFPVVLFNQFKFFSNLFFLLTALAQFYPPLHVGYFFSYFVPLGIVLLVTMLKEAFDDICRYLRDRQINNTEYWKITEGEKRKVRSAALKVGDTIEINAGQRVPADLVLLYTTEASGDVFIKTDQLDGETDWKIRKPIKFIQDSLIGQDDFTVLEMIEENGAYITANPPIPQIYEFEGLFNTKNRNQVIIEPLTLENTLWATTVLAAGTIYGMIVYTGKDTRASMNHSNPRNKVGNTEHELDLITRVLFGVLFGISVIMVAMQGFGDYWVIKIFRFVILLSSIIPISVRVNLDIARVVYARVINSDKKMPGTVVRNSAVPEELGRIEYLLTDKTGTLTQNNMHFRKIALENGMIFSSDHISKLRSTVKRIYGGDDENEPLRGDSNLDSSMTTNKNSFSSKNEKEENLKEISVDIDPYSINNDNSMIVLHDEYNMGTLFEERSLKELKAIVSAISLCHNVSPMVDNGKINFQASSPDEIALVKTMHKLKVQLNHRDQESLRITNPLNHEEEYLILANFPFSSETKRMGIIVKAKETGEIIFYVKGADVVMKDKVKESQRVSVVRISDELAAEGLRTLVFASKTLTEKEFWGWMNTYNEAAQSLNDRQTNINLAIETLEHDMEFLGVTGVEDKLQEDVPEVIGSLRSAKIKTWMLTGDKIETAIAIAKTAGLTLPQQDTYVMRDLYDEDIIANKLREYNGMKDKVLVIDGITLESTFKSNHELFFECTKEALNIVCCRCSPKQKAEIVNGIKRITKKKVCSIGDGGNDVNMIQAANVGIGIEGKEGKQASLASDYSIVKFKYIAPLILYHGRLCYKRSATLIHFVLHRGLINSLIQVIFSLMFYNVSIMMYPGILDNGYTVFFTFCPVFSLILDQDINREVALKHPELYRDLQKGRELNQKSFYIWLWQSIYQAAVIIIPTIFMFDHLEKHYYSIVFISYTALIVVQGLNVYTTMTRVHWFTILSIIGSLGCYVLIVWQSGDSINAPTLSWSFFYTPLLMIVLAWFPIQLTKTARNAFYPKEEQILMNKYKLRKKKVQPLLADIKREV